MTGPAHACRFRQRVVWSGWERSGSGRERTARRVPTCEACGREQPARRPRAAFARELEAADPERLPVLDEVGRSVAGELLSRCGADNAPVPARGLLGALAARAITGSVAEPCLERLMSAGLLRLRYAGPGARALRVVTVLDGAGLAELARPGERAARERALSSARAALDGLDHPVARDARRVLADEAQTIAPVLALALAAVARHATDGEVLAERVFSVRHLGESKALARLRGALEQRLGPLDALGIREGAALTLVGGHGRIALAGGAGVELRDTPPFLGLSRETAVALAALAPPPKGLVAVENLAVFDACCRGEVAELSGAMVVWTAGYPGRGVRAVVEAAVRADAPVSIWCDLDLDGVRIARLVASWCPGARFVRMTPDDLEAAPRMLPLSARALRAIERELAAGPEDDLTETLRALQSRGVWAEQEGFLGERARAFSPRDR
jgi:hypothetical protein